jgi:amidase
VTFDISELSTMDATAQAELVRRGELTPLELVDAAIARIERVNPTLNAVIAPLFEEARAAAVSPDLPDGPFRGVPFLLKDLGAMQKGQPYYMGNRALRDAGFRSPADTPLGTRFRLAGLITLGKTNLPEFGLQSTTQPLAFGATRNPWALERSTSGSSGGSCAAVAAGLVPIAHANDGGGSIRLPAAWCGLVGLKPSRGRISDPLDTLRGERTGCQPHCPRRCGSA